MKFVQVDKNYSNIFFIIGQIDKKIKNWEKKLNFPIHSHFGGKTWFSKNVAVSYTTPHGPLTPGSVPEKTNESIPRKCLNRRTDRPYSYDPSGHAQESYKRISQLSSIAVDNKNKNQLSIPH